MAIKNSWASGEVLTAADLTDTMKGVYLNAQTGTSYTFGTADGFVTLSNSSGGTATIPTNTTAAFNTGAVIGVMNAGTAGSFVIAPAATVTLNAVSGTTTLAPLESATLVKLGTNTWQLAKGSGLPKATYSATTGSPTVTTVSGKTCVQFTGSGSITISQAGTVEVLVIGGGGAGGNYTATTGYNGGGGGAGGYIYYENFYVGAVSYTVTIGAGAAANTWSTQANDTTAFGLCAVGGGSWSESIDRAQMGGSGSGARNSATAVVRAGGRAVSGQGNAGGTGDTTNNSTGSGGSGGGGAGAAGGNGTTSVGGAGGAGTANSITGSSVTYAGGGGGARNSGSAGAGGAGGGGAGGTSGAGTAGTANTGGGGGGSYNTQTPGAGGSGIVILLFG